LRSLESASSQSGKFQNQLNNFRLRTTLPVSHHKPVFWDLSEYEDVLKRPEQRLAHGLTPDAVDEFLPELAALVEPVDIDFFWRPQTRDPNDEMVLEVAINGGADALVTYNLVDFLRAGERFRIPILSPADLLKKVKK
jgi:predicted nucleic acid-binding protein